VYLRKNTSDISVYRQIFFDGEYDIHINEEPRIIIDLGGNIGLFALLMQSRYPGALIISVEPDPDNFIQLQKNTSRFKNIHIYKKAAWHRKELLSLSEKKAGAEWAQNVSSLPGNDSVLEKIESITINELMSNHGLREIDLLKIDIEGAEAELFSENIEWLNNVKVMAIELHDFMKLNSSNNFFKAL
jgi:FkbM family methyltransferase